MASTINAVSGTGVKTTSDGSGIVKVQSNGVTTNALAWVNFNGVTTASINASYNVSSVTRNGTGDYTVNFTNSTTDINYCPVINCRTPAGGSASASVRLFGYYNSTSGTVNQAPTLSNFRFLTFVPSVNNGIDCDYLSIAVFGN